MRITVTVGQQEGASIAAPAYFMSEQQPQITSGQQPFVISQQPMFNQQPMFSQQPMYYPQPPPPQAAPTIIVNTNANAQATVVQNNNGKSCWQILCIVFWCLVFWPVGCILCCVWS